MSDPHHHFPCTINGIVCHNEKELEAAKKHHPNKDEHQTHIENNHEH